MECFRGVRCITSRVFIHCGEVREMWGYGIGVLYKTCPWKKNSEFSRLFKLFVKCDELIDYFSHLSQEWFVHIFDFFFFCKGGNVDNSGGRLSLYKACIIPIRHPAARFSLLFLIIRL